MAARTSIYKEAWLVPADFVKIAKLWNLAIKGLMFNGGGARKKRTAVRGDKLKVKRKDRCALTQ